MTIRKAVNLATYTFVALFFLLVSLNVAGISLSGKQFVYSLSLMTPEEAYNTVLNRLQPLILEIDAESPAKLLTEDTIVKGRLKAYLAEASELTTIERQLLSFYNKANTGWQKTVCIIISGITITLLIFTQLRDGLDCDRKQGEDATASSSKV